MEELKIYHPTPYLTVIDNNSKKCIVPVIYIGDKIPSLEWMKSFFEYLYKELEMEHYDFGFKSELDMSIFYSDCDGELIEEYKIKESCIKRIIK